jgi:hypothetical protein
MTCVLECRTWKNISNKLDSDILDIRNDLREQSQRISDEEFHYNIVETRVSAI